MLNDLLTEYIVKMLCLNLSENYVNNFLRTRINHYFDLLNLDITKINYQLKVFEQRDIMAKSVIILPQNTYTQDCLDEIEVYLSMQNL